MEEDEKEGREVGGERRWLLEESGEEREGRGGGGERKEEEDTCHLIRGALGCTGCTGYSALEVSMTLKIFHGKM